MSLVVSLALVLAGEGLVSPVLAAPVSTAGGVAAVGDAGSVASDPVVRPDAVSAMVSARAEGRRVEDLSRRSESTQVFANPDGSWTEEAFTGPVRVQDEAGVWHGIDTTLVARDGGFAPRYAASDVVLSDGGDTTFASMSEDGRDLAWKWPEVLPEPVVDGSTATYRDVLPDGDLVVTALPTGFSHSVVLREQPTGPVDLVVPVATDGAAVVERPSGELAVQTQAGEELVSAPKPVMWDSSDPTGSSAGSLAGPVVSDGVDQTPLNTSVDDPTVGPAPVDTVPVDTVVGKNAAGTPTVTLSPDAGFLADPDTVYPVTIDPTWTSGTTGDTYILNTGPGDPSDTSLRVGTTDGGAHVRRAFLHFDVPHWVGKHVTAATLRMHNWNSGSCTGAAIRVQRLTQDWTTGQVTWGNQPTASTDSDVDFSPAYGVEPGCPNADATWDVTSMVQKWVADPATNYGLRVKAVTETNNNTYRSYVSGNYNGGGDVHRPKITWTYNSYPGTAAAPGVAPAARYASGGTSTAASYTSSTTPTFSSKASDSDGGTVSLRLEARTAASATATLAASCTTGSVAQGKTASCAPTTGLVEGSTYYLRAKAFDGLDWAGTSQTATAGWSSWTKFVVAAGVPGKPSVSCPGYADGSWTSTAPAGEVACTITAAAAGTSAPVRIHYAVNGATETVVNIAQSSDPGVARTTVSVPRSAGGYDLVATAESPSGLLSDDAHYRFGYGQLGMAAPPPAAVDPLPVTTGALALDASGPPSSAATAPTARVQWRLAASGENAATGWNDAPAGSVSDLTVTNDPAAGIRVTGRWDTMAADHDAFAGTGSAGLDLDDRKPVMIDVQVCVGYASGEQCTWSTNPRSVLRVPHAFGNGFPTADVAAGQVALWTGEFAADATDVSVPGYTGELSLSRTAATFAGPPAKAAGVFGPGWTAQLDGPGTGLAGMQLLDGTRADGTLMLQDGDGSVMVFAPHAGATQRTTPALVSGAWDPVDQEARLAGISATVSVTGTAPQDTVVTFTEADGTTTSFNAAVEPSASTDAVFVPVTIDEPGAEGVTRYNYDSTGRVTRIWQAPAGVGCPTTALVAGCRVLRLDYAPNTTTVAGEAPGQLRAVWMDIWNPIKPDGTGGTGAMDTVQVAKYGYDTSKRLVSVSDPRSNLTTGYTYDGTSSRLATITPPGLIPVQVEYTGADHKLARVKRDRPAGDPAGGTATLATVLYGVPVTGSAALPSLTQARVETWGQASAPTYAAAVFGPDKPVATLDPAQVPAGDWVFADLSYTDARGYTVNTAAHGAGAWQVTSTGYDDLGNVVRELDAGDVNAVVSGQVAAPDAGIRTVYNTDRKNTDGDVVLPAGSVVTDTYGPVRQAVIADGSLAWVRPHTHTDYDQGAPNGGVDTATGQAYVLPTTETTTADDAATGEPVQTLSFTKTGYDPISTGDTSGWVLGAATTETTVLGGGQPDIVTKTRYDSVGRVIETRQPASTGTDAGTRRTSYYKATGTATTSNCDGRPQWAGLPCVTDYAAAPTTGAGTASGPVLPTTRVAGYSMLLKPATVTETGTNNGTTTTRTTTTGYLPDGRTSTKSTTVTGLPGSTPVPDTRTTYDPATGLPTKTESLDATGTPTGAPLSTGYDTWGRTTSYTAGTGETTTTSYTPAGQVDTIATTTGATTLGTTSYSYAPTDAVGNAEHRGLPTKVSVSNPGGPPVEFTGAYDAKGTLTTQTLPGGLTQRTETDLAGEPTGLTYSGQVTTTNPDGSNTVKPDEPWLSWSQDNDVLGRVRLEATPAGVAFDGDLTAGGAAGYSRVYTYDQADRLTQVLDNTAPTGLGGLPEPVTDPMTGTSTGTNPAGTTCQTRTYGFDPNGNRKILTRTPANPDGSCNTTTGSTGSSTTTTGYDTADRITTPGYTYDPLGRATTIPATDTPTVTTGANGTTPLTLGYYDTDAARSLTQNGAITTYTLDPAGRRTTATTTPTTGSTPTESTQRHYTDGSDNPGWTTTATPNGTSTTRYAESLAGDLAATITTSGTSTTSVTLPLVNLHGDTPAQITLPTTGPATTIDTWTNTDEYGNPLGSSTTSGTGTTTSGGIHYNWLGGKQRATDTTGLLLMGARLYNPTTGQFTTSDPVYGGNTTTYTYPQDPTNAFDLTGLWEWVRYKLSRPITDREARRLADDLRSGASEAEQINRIARYVPIGAWIIDLMLTASQHFFERWADRIDDAASFRGRYVRIYIGIQRSSRSIFGLHAYRLHAGAIPWNSSRA